MSTKTLAKELPKSLIIRLRIKDILQNATKIDPAADTPATRYLRHIAPTLYLPRLNLEAFREHPALNHWAGRSGTWPALILRARRTSADRTSALHCIFLTPEGAPAPLVSPRLLLGPLDGAAVSLAQTSGVTYLCEQFETALRLIEARAPGAVVYALKRENMARVTLPRSEKVICVFGAERGVDLMAQAICNELRCRGLKAHAVAAPPHSKIDCASWDGENVL